MAKRRRSHKRKATHRRKYAKRNPIMNLMGKTRKRRRSHAKRNPGFKLPMIGSVGGIFKPIVSNLDLAGWGVAGYIVNKKIPEFLPWTKDTVVNGYVPDWQLYATKAGLTLLLSMLAGKFVNQRAGIGIAIGGTGEIIVTALENSPWGTQIGLFNGVGQIGYRNMKRSKMGEIVNAGSQRQAMSEIVPAGSMGSIGGNRFSSRF